MLHIELYGSINYDPCLGSSVRFSAAPLTTLTAGHSITSDSVSPICVTGTKTYDSPPQPTAPVSEVINFSSSRCGDGDPGNTGRGSQ